MTKKDYQLIADSIHRSGIIKDKNQIRQQAREAMRRLIAHDLAGRLKHDNLNFDTDKFMKACGIYI